MHSWSTGWRVCTAVLTFACITVAQLGQQKRTLVVNGRSGDATIVQIDNRSYIDLETLARIANDSLSFEAKQIVLTIPSSAANAPAVVPTDRQASDSALSNDFMKATIEDLATIKEWYGLLAYAIQQGIPEMGAAFSFTATRRPMVSRWQRWRRQTTLSTMRFDCSPPISTTSRSGAPRLSSPENRWVRQITPCLSPRSTMTRSIRR